MKSLAPHQVSGINELAVKYREGKRRIIYQLGTGGGKTVLFSGLIHRFLNKTDKKVVILVHREELLNQARRTIYEWYGLIAEPVTPQTKKLSDAKIYVSMVETANNRLKKNPVYFGDVGLLVVDEAHLGNFRKLLPLFSCLTIGFTATPLSSSKKQPLNLLFEDIVCGPQIKELIAAGKLTKNITYHVKNINRATLAISSKGDFDDKQMGIAYSKAKQINNTVEAYKKHALGLKTIIFNCNIEHSRLVNQAFIDAGFNSKHLDGDSQDRINTFKWFNDTPDAILNNVGIATTGFDQDDILCVIMNKSTLSAPLWLQCTGRGSRIAPKKDVFLILDLGGNALSHGDWCDNRNWADIFHNPPKPGDGKGAPPVKNCDQCDAILPASATVCEFCGYVYVRIIQQDTSPIELIRFSSSEVDVKAVIEKNEGHKEYAALHKIKSFIIYEAKRKGAKDIGPAIAGQLSEIYQSKVKEWCKERGKRYSQWHKQTTAEWFNQELTRVFNYKPL